jgi:hypothetical protein
MSMNTITWTIEMGNSKMGSPFAINEIHKRHGKLVKIISVKQEGNKITFEACYV